MADFKVQQNRYRKVTGLTEAGPDDKSAGKLRAIVKVNVDGYVPENVEVRQRIDDTMFTADFFSERLDQLEADDSVASVAVSKKLDTIE